MRSQTLVVFLSSALAVSAIPTQAVKRDWVSDNNGNIKISFSDEKVKLGTVTVDSIMDSLSSHCGTQGTCDTGVETFKGQLIAAGTGGEVDDITVSVTPNGAYPTWIHNGLLEALRAAVNAAAVCSDVKNTQTCPTTEAYCPAKTTTTHECVVPRYWGINYQAADAGDAAPPNINANLATTVDGNGYCSTFATVGSAIAGAVNGAAGGIFTLIGLACAQ